MKANILAWWQISWRQMKKTFWGNIEPRFKNRRPKLRLLIFSHSVLWVFVKSMVLSFFASLTKPATGVRENKKAFLLRDCVLGVLGALAWRLI